MEVATKITDLQDKTHQLCLREEIYWKQRSKIEWLKGKDRNRHFHARASQRKKKAIFIQSLVNKHGASVSHLPELQSSAIGYFSNLFTLKISSTQVDFMDFAKPMLLRL